MYHVGLIKGSGKVAYWGNNHKKSTVIVQLRKDKDYLSCELWQYIGTFDITKKQVKEGKQAFLLWINMKYDTNFTHLIVD